MKLSPKCLKEVREYAYRLLLDELGPVAWYPLKMAEYQAIRAELRRLAAELRKGGEK